jgi:hypothetical protein
MTDALRAFTDSLGWSDVSASTLKRDVDCFVHTYLSRGQDAGRTDDVVECPLASLGILVQEFKWVPNRHCPPQLSHIPLLISGTPDVRNARPLTIAKSLIGKVAPDIRRRFGPRLSGSA